MELCDKFVVSKQLQLHKFKKLIFSDDKKEPAVKYVISLTIFEELNDCI